MAQSLHTFVFLFPNTSLPLSFSSILSLKTKPGVVSLCLTLNSQCLSINECLSSVKEAMAADERSLGIAASPRDRREITICIKHRRGTGDTLIKTKLA